MSSLREETSLQKLSGMARIVEFGLIWIQVYKFSFLSVRSNVNVFNLIQYPLLQMFSYIAAFVHTILLSK